MKPKKNIYKKNIVLLGGFLFFAFFAFLDQWLKFFARTHREYTHYIIEPWIGWEYLGNGGVAFGIPVPNTLLLIVTPFILLFLSRFFLQHKKPSTTLCVAYILILGGALSNFIDRLLFGITIDYFRILTSVFNVADIMIVVGAGLLIVEEYKKKK